MRGKAAEDLRMTTVASLDSFSNGRRARTPASPLELSRLAVSGCRSALPFGSLAVGGFEVLHALRERGRLHDLPVAALVPGTASILFSLIPNSGGVVEILVHEARRRSNLPDGEWVLAKAFERERESLHVSDLARHQKLERIFWTGIIAVVEEA